MIKLKTLALSLSALGLSTAALPVYAATDAEFEALRQKVTQLEQLVQQLSQQQPPSELRTAPLANETPASHALTPNPAARPAPPISAAAKPVTKKDGWFLLPDGQTQVKPYGSIRADATYDLEGTNSSTKNVNNPTASVPLNSENATKNELNVTAATTRFGIDFLRPTELGDLTGKIEADFMGSNGTNGDGSVRVRHAYLSLDRWLIGQTTSPFVNTETSPETADFNGAMGNGTRRTVQVRYTHPIQPNQKLLLALEGGDVDRLSTGNTLITQNGVASSGGNRFPALTARYDFASQDQAFLGQVHGLLHENRVSTNDSNDEEKLGWGIGLGARYKITPADTLFANYYHVEGDNRYLLYSSPAAYVATQNADGSLNIDQHEFDSFSLGYGRTWSPKWRSSLIAGGIWYKDDNGYARFASNSNTSAAVRESLNKTLYNIVVNTFYKPVKNVDFGLEYTYGQRKIFERTAEDRSDKGDLSRVNFLARYSF